MIRKKRGDPKRNAYREQRNNAKRRGIAFELSFEAWVEWWGDDWQRRGRASGCLVMARFDDAGPYAVGNIYKALHTGKVLVGRELTAEDRLAIGRRLVAAHAARRASGGRHHWEVRNARMVRTDLGLFDGIQKAADAHRVHRQTIWRWVRAGRAWALNLTPAQAARARVQAADRAI